MEETEGKTWNWNREENGAELKGKQSMQMLGNYRDGDKLSEKRKGRGDTREGKKSEPETTEINKQN